MGDGLRDTGRPYFLAFYNAESCSNRLTVPSGFVRHLGGTVTGSASLSLPSGGRWPVELTRQDDELFFFHGWAAFVGVRHIETGDSLVFRYEGFLNFTVLVFDSSGCEKDDAEFRKTTTNVATTSMVIHDGPWKSFGNVPKKRRGSVGNIDCSSMDETKDLGTARKCMPSSAKRRSSMGLTSSSSRSLCKKLVASVDRHESGNTPRSTAKTCGSWRRSTHEERRTAEDFLSSYPVFVRIMKGFNVSGSYTLKIPCEFATEHLPTVRVRIVLRNAKGDSWAVNSVPTTKINTFHTLCGGWMAFVRGNDIKLGDTCVFELIRKCELRVHVVEMGVKVARPCHAAPLPARTPSAESPVPPAPTDAEAGTMVVYHPCEDRSS